MPERFLRRKYCLAAISRYSDGRTYRPPPLLPPNMGKIVRCRECGEVYRDIEALELLRDNDSVCTTCNSTIEVADWDRILASYEDDEGDVDDDEDDWEDEEEADEDEDDDVGDEDFDDLDEDEDEEDEDEDEDEDEEEDEDD
ncbi:MAG: hypothetical protein RL398_3168 [Planctomycetota bacterium]